jgi:hypothetical protein
VKTVGAVLALGFALGVLYITEIGAEYACGEREPCDAISSPVVMSGLAFIGLVGVVVSLFLARRRIRSLTAAAVAFTAAVYVAWIMVFIYVAEGSLSFV